MSSFTNPTKIDSETQDLFVYFQKRNLTLCDILVLCNNVLYETNYNKTGVVSFSLFDSTLFLDEVANFDQYLSTRLLTKTETINLCDNIKLEATTRMLLECVRRGVK